MVVVMWLAKDADIYFALKSYIISKWFGNSYTHTSMVYFLLRTIQWGEINSTFGSSSNQEEMASARTGVCNTKQSVIAFRPVQECIHSRGTIGGNNNNNWQTATTPYSNDGLHSTLWSYNNNFHDQTTTLHEHASTTTTTTNTTNNNNQGHTIFQHGHSWSRRCIA